MVRINDARRLDHGMSIIASCATSSGQAKWMSCEVEEVERSISVFYGNADLDFVRGIKKGLTSSACGEPVEP